MYIPYEIKDAIRATRGPDFDEFDELPEDLMELLIEIERKRDDAVRKTRDANDTIRYLCGMIGTGN